MDSSSYNSIAAIIGYVGAAIALIALVISAWLAVNTWKVFKQNKAGLENSTAALKHAEQSLQLQIKTERAAKAKEIELHQQMIDEENDSKKTALFNSVKEFNDYLNTKHSEYEVDGLKKNINYKQAIAILSNALVAKPKDRAKMVKEIDVAAELAEDVYNYYLFSVETNTAIKHKGNNTEITLPATKDVKTWKPIAHYIQNMFNNLTFIKNFAIYIKDDGVENDSNRYELSFFTEIIKHIETSGVSKAKSVNLSNTAIQAYVKYWSTDIRKSPKMFSDMVQCSTGGTVSSKFIDGLGNSIELSFAEYKKRGAKVAENFRNKYIHKKALKK